MLLVTSVIALIAAAVFGIDKGVLLAMANPEYARGLITFLFALVTIGSALVLIVSGLIGEGGEISDKQFQRGKEVLSLLLGVFGTILGYYFGSIHSSVSTTTLRISGVEAVPHTSPPEGSVTAKALAAGGTPPYRYTISFTESDRKSDLLVTENGVIVEQLRVPDLPPGKSAHIRLAVEDALGREAETSTTVEIIPR
jgi:hypothetical protein